VVVRANRLAAPIRVPAGPRWPGRSLRAIRFGLDRDNAVVALAGFLVRGGIALLALPGVVLPSIIGIAGSVGISSFAIDGSPTRQLFLLIALIVIAALVWLAIAGFVGSLVDAWLIEAAVSRENAAGVERPLPDAGLIMDLVAVRGICLLPLAVAMTWAGTRIYSAAYAELVTPTNLVVPIFVRVVQSAADAVVVVAIAWLVTETVSAVAVRRMVMGGEGVGAAIGRGLLQIVRRPVTTALTVVTWTAVSVAATAAAIAATATAYSWTLDVARLGQPLALTLGLGPLSTTRDFRPVAFVILAAVMAGVWIAGAAIAAAASAWRSAAWTAEVASALGLPLDLDTAPAPEPAQEIGEPI
jgi:hypothetical protein